MMSNVKYVCLNPKCLFPSNRAYLSGENSQHRNCSRWKFPYDENEINNLDSQDLLKGQLSISFQNEGLLAIQKILKLKQWPQHLSLLFEDLKLKINEDLEKIKTLKIKQFEEIYQLAEAANQQFKVIKQKMGNDDIKNYLFKTKSIQQLEKKAFLNLQQAQKIKKIYQTKTKESMDMIGNLLQSQKPTFNQLDYKQKMNALEKANELFFENNDIPVNEKIQKLATLLKTQMIKISFDSSAGLYQASCWKCQNICYSPKQDPTRLACMQQFFTHLTRFHVKQVYLNYMSRILKYQAEQITIQNLITKISTQDVNEIFLIDRQNAGTIERPLQLNGILWVEVVNKENKNLAKGQFIVADSKRKDAADIIMTIVTYQVIKMGIKKVTLVTKDHFGVTLMELLNGQLKNGRLQCIHPKEFIQKVEGYNNQIKVI